MDSPGLVVTSLAEVTWVRRQQERRVKHLQGLPEANRILLEEARSWILTTTRSLSDLWQGRCPTP